MYDALCLKKDFEARGDGETDDRKAILKWWKEGMDSGLPMYMEKGNYLCRDPLELDIAPARDNGFKILGVGLRHSVIELASIDSKTEVPFKIFCSSKNEGKQDHFYHQLREIGIVGRRNGPIVQLGEDDLCDPLNSFFLEKSGINNDYRLQPREEDLIAALRVNFACQGVIDIVANCGQQEHLPPEQAHMRRRAGAAIEARQMQFTRICGSYSNARHGVRLIDGYSFGNHFDTLNIEEVETGVVIDSDFARTNTFTAGTCVGVNGLDFLRGENNQVNNMNFGLYEECGGQRVLHDIGLVEPIVMPARVVPYIPRALPKTTPVAA